MYKGDILAPIITFGCISADPLLRLLLAPTKKCTLLYFSMSTKGRYIHSKSEKVCGTAFSVKKKLRKKCVNPGVIFGPFWVIFGAFWIILGHSRAILGHIWVTLGHFGSFLAIFGPFCGFFGEICGKFKFFCGI